MRFVPLNCVKEGMVLAKPLLGINDELLLNRGVSLKSSYLKKIEALGYNGIYIEDNLSKDIEVEDVIDTNLRFKAVKTIKKTFGNLEKDEKTVNKSLDAICDIVSSMLDEILSKKELAINMIDLKAFDDYTFYHSVNVTVLSLVTAVSMNLNRNQLYNLGITALLHDMGKVFVPKEILNKKESLNDEEFSVIRKHPKNGYEFVRNFSRIPCSSLSGILHHHERYDGTGYPGNLSRDRISLFGKIIAVADVYDALTSDRPYRKALKPSDAVEYVMGGSSTLFAPEAVSNFIYRISPYPVGTAVLLSNDTRGIVVKNHPDSCLRPRIRIFMHGNRKVQPYIVDLKEDKSMTDVVLVDIVNI